MIEKVDGLFDKNDHFVDNDSFIWNPYESVAFINHDGWDVIVVSLRMVIVTPFPFCEATLGSMWVDSVTVYGVWMPVPRIIKVTA